MTWTIRVDDISYGYDADETVLEHCTAAFRTAGIYAILGENGVGKTTLLELLTNNLLPDHGSVSYLHDGEAVSYPTGAVGYMSSGFDVYERLTVSQLTALIQSLRQIDSTTLERTREYAGMLDLERYADYPVDTLSTGTRARLHLFLTLMHDPDVVILDEPTSGLDPNQFTIFQQLLHTLRQQGKLIIIATHALRLAAETSTTVLVLTGKQLHELRSTSLTAMEQEFSQLTHR